MKLESANNIGLDLADTLSERSLTYIKKTMVQEPNPMGIQDILPFRKKII